MTLVNIIAGLCILIGIVCVVMSMLEERQP